MRPEVTKNNLKIEAETYIKENYPTKPADVEAVLGDIYRNPASYIGVGGYYRAENIAERDGIVSECDQPSEHLPTLLTALRKFKEAAKARPVWDLPLSDYIKLLSVGETTTIKRSIYMGMAGSVDIHTRQLLALNNLRERLLREDL